MHGMEADAKNVMIMMLVVGLLDYCRLVHFDPYTYTHRSSFLWPFNGASPPPPPTPHSGTPAGLGTRTFSSSSRSTAANENFFVRLGALVSRSGSVSKPSSASESDGLDASNASC